MRQRSNGFPASRPPGALTSQFNVTDQKVDTMMHKAIRWCSIMLFLLPGISWGQQVTLKGRFILDGPPPTPKPYNSTTSQLYRGQVPDESVLVDSNTGGLSNIVIYLDAPKDAPAVVADDSEPFVDLKLDRYIQFQPRVVILRCEQRLRIDVSETPPRGLIDLRAGGVRNTFDRPFVKGGSREKIILHGKPKTLIPERTPANLAVDSAGWTQGYFLVTDRPAAVTSTDGRFEISDLPPGKLTFRVWHEKAGYLSPQSTNVGSERNGFSAQADPGVQDLGDLKVTLGTK